MQSLFAGSAALAAVLGVVCGPALAADVPQAVNTINGKELPGMVAGLEDVSIMLDTIDAN